jgi:DNA-binding MarR family transcriptional regulator
MRMSDDENATLLLDTVPRVMHAVREEMRSLARGRFTVPQFRILNRLNKGAMTNRDLAEWMGVTPPTMSRMLECLETKSLIQRKCDPSDRRVQTLTLTASGKREADKIRKTARERFASRIKTLSSDESRALAAGLQILAEMFPAKLPTVSQSSLKKGQA